MNHCKVALSNLIASDRVTNSDNPFQAFSDGVLNFFNHYCLDDHSVIMKRYKCILHALYNKVYIILLVYIKHYVNV